MNINTEPPVGGLEIMKYTRFTPGITGDNQFPNKHKGITA